MMKQAILLAAIALIIDTPSGLAQQSPATPPTTASAEVMQCAQAQMVVDRLLSTVNSRLETARQANSAADMRAAVDALQATLRDVRAQLAPCASVQPAGDAHAGHTMPSAGTTPAPPSAPAVKPATTIPGAAAPKPAAADPHAGHVPAPAAPATKPAAATRPPIKPSPPPADAHVGHTRAPAKPAAPGKPSTDARPGAAAKPPATDPHAGHTAAPAKPAPAATKTPPAPPNPTPTTKPPVGGDRHVGNTPTAESPASTAKEQVEATDPVCGLKVDPKTAPNAPHQGRTYYFCSDQHRQLFSKNPAKYLPGRQ